MIELQDGWDHLEKENRRCIIANLSFIVVCSGGFKPNRETRTCEAVPESFEAVCQTATVSVGSTKSLTMDGSENTMVGMIGKTAQLKVTVDRQKISHMQVQLVPVEGRIRLDSAAGLFKTSVTSTGDYNVYITEENASSRPNQTKSTSSCFLPSVLRLKCVVGYDQMGTQCVPEPDKSTSGLNVAMGASLGTVLALCVCMFMYLVRRNRHKVKQVFLSFLRTCNGFCGFTGSCELHHCRYRGSSRLENCV